MKNLQIGDNDLIGNKFNGHDLHIYLNKIGIESNHLIANSPISNDKKTFQIGSDYAKGLRNKMIEADDYYNLVGGTHTLPYDIMYNKLFLKSDVVHMHLIQNQMFNFNLLPLMTSLKPTVWTLHDPSSLTGHCIHPFECKEWKEGCKDCPSLQIPFNIDVDTTALNWEMKRIAIQNSQITFIVSSKWMYNLVKQSPIFKHCDVHIVPFGIDQNIFKSAETELAKQKLGISPDSTTIMFRAGDNLFKGVDLLLETLPKLKSKNNKKITLIIVNSDKRFSGSLERKFNILKYGWINDDKKLAQLYQACDMFLMPSRAESFGMMAVEAMSVGKLIIAVKGTALSDTTKAPKIGVLCDRNPEALRIVIQNFIDNPDERRKRGELARQYALTEYNLEKYIKKIVEVYKIAIKNHKPSAHRDIVVAQLLKHKPYKKVKENLITQKVYLFGFIMIGKLSRNLYNDDSVTVLKFPFKKKVYPRKTKYYFLGIPILKIRTLSNVAGTKK
ncbi:glycosyltransferase [Pseudomonadota bacterium]